MEKQQLAIMALLITCIAIYIAFREYWKASQIYKGAMKSRFKSLQGFSPEKLRAEIAAMSIEKKEEMLDDILQYGQATENNYRVAIVILQYMVEELKPNVRL